MNIQPQNQKYSYKTFLIRKLQNQIYFFYHVFVPEFDAAFNFGTRYSKKCQIPAHILFEQGPNPKFYDLYIPYKSDTSNAGSSNKLVAIPITILNKEQNRDKSNDKKELTTRLFMVDTVTGNSMGKEQKVPEVVRYLKKMTIQ